VYRFSAVIEPEADCRRRQLDNEGVIQTLYIRLLRRGNVDKIVIFSPLAPVYKLPSESHILPQARMQLIDR